MKKSERIKAETMAKIKTLTRHIRNVEDNCLILGERLIGLGHSELGHHLIANGFVHDASKFHGIEWDYLSILPSKEQETKLKLKLAIHHHNSTNKHHPEAWAKGIKEMPDVYLAEFVCDTKARSEEFGTSLRDWIEEVATKKWEFSKTDDVYQKIIGFVDLLCDKPFEQSP